MDVTHNSRAEDIGQQLMARLQRGNRLPTVAEPPMDDASCEDFGADLLRRLREAGL